MCVTGWDDLIHLNTSIINPSATLIESFPLASPSVLSVRSALTGIIMVLVMPGLPGRMICFTYHLFVLRRVPFCALLSPPDGRAAGANARPQRLTIQKSTESPPAHRQRHVMSVFMVVMPCTLVSVVGVCLCVSVFGCIEVCMFVCFILHALSAFY